METRSVEPLGGLGIVYAVLFLIVNILIGNGAKTGTSGATVVSYYNTHKASQTAAVFVVAAAVLAFVFFMGALNRRLDTAGNGTSLSSVITAGSAIYAVGLLIMATLLIALIDTTHYKMYDAAQTLNVLSQDAWVPVVVGLSIVALGTGAAALLTSALPRWLGWASVCLGVLSVAGPLGGIAFVIAPLWTLVIGVVLMRSPKSGQPPTEQTAVGQAVTG